MKNMIKRILLLLPVISVLLVALAVPAFADYSPEMGWSEPVLVEEVYQFPWGYNGTQIIDLYGWYAYQFADFSNSALPSGVYDLIPQDVEYWQLLDVDGEYFVVKLRGMWHREDGFLLAYVVGLDGTAADISIELGNSVFIFEQYPLPATEEFLEILPSIPFNIGVLGGFPAISPTEPIGNVWTCIMTWITSALNSVMGAFYVDGSLTLLGTLSVIGVSVGICFLLIALIQRFLHLRG